MMVFCFLEFSHFCIRSSSSFFLSIICVRRVSSLSPDVEIPSVTWSGILIIFSVIPLSITSPAVSSLSGTVCSWFPTLSLTLSAAFTDVLPSCFWSSTEEKLNVFSLARRLVGETPASATSTRGDRISESLEKSSGISKLGTFGGTDCLGRGFAQLTTSTSWFSRKNPPSPEKSFDADPEKNFNSSLYSVSHNLT